MKKYFFRILIACLLTSTLYAQQENNTEFKTKTLQVFQNLDKNRVPHGILLDFGMEFTNVRAFSGVLTDSTYTTSQTLSDLYKTLLMCRVRDVTTGFVTPEEYATRWYTQRTKGVVTLSGQYFKYNRFTDNAYPNKLNYSSNKFSDKFVLGIWQNPYEEKQLFAMAPSVDSYQGLHFQVKLPSNLFFSNYPALVQNIQVDFSDGLGYRIVTPDQLVDINYSEANTYTWKYKITLTNGQTLLNHSKIIVEEGLNAVDFDDQSSSRTQTSSTASSFSGYTKKTITATTPYLGHYGSATVYIRYAYGNTITKPLIVAEGFDTGIVLKPEREAGDNNIKTFINNINDSNSLLPNEISYYDLIYVDWNNGVDFIQRNAYVLEEVIKWVNQNKSGTQQNVVLGQSMGGLVARYALKDMENKGLNHDTRLYVSHDAPQLGADLPLSIQYSARHLRNMYVSTPIAFTFGEIVLPLVQNFAEGFTQIINVFGGDISIGSELANQITPLQAFSISDVPAARQMQYNWVNRSYQINNVIHDAWQQELTQMGYPAGYPAQGKPIRNIAIANGSECGVTQINKGNIVSYIKDAGRGTFLSNYIGILDAFYGSLINRPDVILASLFPGKSYWQIDFQSRYMTTLNESKIIYHGLIKYKKKVFGFIPVSITITEKDFNQPVGFLPHDIYGGGTIIPAASQIPLSGITSNIYGFIPTASALDIGKGATVINDADYRKSYIGAVPPIAPKNSPFDNFVTHFDQGNLNNSNSGHIDFNRRNGDWLRAELNTGVADEYTNCSYMCANTEISGADELCGVGTYSVPTGGEYNEWFINDGEGEDLVTITGGNTSTVTLTPTGVSSGQVTLNIQLGGTKCGDLILRKVIWVGKPIFQVQGDCTVHQPNIIRMRMLGPDNLLITNQGITATTWEKIAYNGTVTNIANGYGGVTNHDFYQIKVTATNPCGTSEMVYDIDTLPVTYTGFETRAMSSTNVYSVYPNPSNDIVNIELRDQNTKSNDKASISGELYDFMGQFKTKVQIIGNRATFSVRGLNKGIYVLKIYVNGNIENHRIAVE